VIRLGGNSEDKAVHILEELNGRIPAVVEGYKKDDSPDFCAARLDALIKSGELRDVPPPYPQSEPQKPYRFETVTKGTVTFDHAVCATCETTICVEECARQILSLNDDGLPVLNITHEEARKGQCVECLACEVACLLEGAGGGHIHLPIPGLQETKA
jgi:hypothetical protein